MKDNDIKKVFDSIKADKATKLRILNEIYDESKKNNLNKKDILGGKYMINKKLIPALALSAIFVCGIFLYYRNTTTNNNITNPPSSYPPVNEEYVPDKEFNNFDLQSLKENTTKIEIRNHVNSTVFKEITNKEFINTTLDNLDGLTDIYEDIDKEKDKAYKILESIAQSQAIGNSITMSFITKDNVTSSIRVNIDLDIISVNDKYYHVSPDFINNLKNELKTIKNLNEINIPGQG